MVWNSHPLRKCNFLFKEQIKMLRIFLILYFFFLHKQIFFYYKIIRFRLFRFKNIYFSTSREKTYIFTHMSGKASGGGGLRVFHTFHLLFILFRINWNIKVLIQYILLQNCKISKSYLGCPPPPPLFADMSAFLHKIVLELK